MITKTTIEKGSVGNKKGWCFNVYYGKEYPNFISALYKTKKEIKQQLDRYINSNGKDYDWYGSAE